MDVHNMPASDYVGESEKTDVLATMLTGVLNNWPYFTHYDCVEGMPCSARIIYVGPQPNAVSFPQSFTPREVAHELMRLTDQDARYAPPRFEGAKKGWRIQSCVVKGRPAAIAVAHWIKR